jgi:hypothetical protein
MKKLCTGFLSFVLAFSFTSCSTNETDIEIPQESLLKSYKLKRDVNGAYSIEYNVADNTVSDARKDINSLTNEFHLSKVGYDAKDQYRENVSLNANTLHIGFFDTETGRSMKLTVEDENITFAKGSSTRFLKTFGLATNNDGTIQLDFEINDSVVAEFVYNEDLAIHEVHLRKGTSTDKVFSRSLTIPDTGVLKLDFVNHNLLGKGTSEVVERKPRVTTDSSYY